MRKKLAAIMVMLGLMGGCQSLCKSFKESYEKSFRASWKESFVKSCIGNNTEEQAQLCNCIADKALAELTVDQLQDVSYATQYIQDRLIPACQEEPPAEEN